MTKLSPAQTIALDKVALNGEVAGVANPNKSRDDQIALSTARSLVRLGYLKEVEGATNLFVLNDDDDEVVGEDFPAPASDAALIEAAKRILPADAPSPLMDFDESRLRYSEALRAMLVNGMKSTYFGQSPEVLARVRAARKLKSKRVKVSRKANRGK